TLPNASPVTVAEVHTGDVVCSVFALPEKGRRCGEVWPEGERARKHLSGDMTVNFVAEHGMSGSGVWDMRGDLVGIVVHLRPCLGHPRAQDCTMGGPSLASRSWIAAP